MVRPDSEDQDAAGEDSTALAATKAGGAAAGADARYNKADGDEVGDEGRNGVARSDAAGTTAGEAAEGTAAGRAATVAEPGRGSLNVYDQVHCPGAYKRLACMVNVCYVLHVGWAQGCFQGGNSIAKFASRAQNKESDLKYGQWQVNLLAFD